jgi:hypothetical protein
VTISESDTSECREHEFTPRTLLVQADLIKRPWRLPLESEQRKLVAMAGARAEDTPPIPVEALVRLLFRTERETTTLGRALQQLTDSQDTIEVNFPFDDDMERGDFVQFLMSELHATYETLILLSMEVDRLKSSS